jgi:hypothetical protein
MEDTHAVAATIAIAISGSEPPRVYAIPGGLGPELLLGEEVFRDSLLGDWLGFYDWLRTSSGEVIGVRLWVDSPIERLRAAGKCAGVVAAEDCFPLMIYFGEGREFDELLSDDQDFGSNMLLVGANGFALTFNSPWRG